MALNPAEARRRAIPTDPAVLKAQAAQKARDAVRAASPVPITQAIAPAPRAGSSLLEKAKAAGVKPELPITETNRRGSLLEKARRLGIKPANPPQAPPKEVGGTNYEASSVGQVASDALQAAKAGTREAFAKPIFEAVAWVGDQFGADLKTAKGIADMLSVHAAEDRAKMSEEGRGALTKGSLTDPFALTLKVVNTLPSLLTTLVPSIGAANIAARGKAGIEAAKAGAKAAGIVGSATEGAQILGSTAGSIREFFDQAPDADIRKAAAAAEIEGYADKSVDELRAELKGDFTNRMAPALSGMVGAVTGYVGGKAVGKLIGEGGTLLERTLRGGGIEAGQEAPQSAAETAITQYATERDVDGGKVASAAVEGAVLGGITGGVVTGIMGSDKSDTETGGAVGDAEQAALAGVQRDTSPADDQTAAIVAAGEQKRDEVLAAAQQARALSDAAEAADAAHKAASEALRAELAKGSDADPALVAQLKQSYTTAVAQRNMAHDALKFKAPAAIPPTSVVGQSGAIPASALATPESGAAPTLDELQARDAAMTAATPVPAAPTPYFADIRDGSAPPSTPKGLIPIPIKGVGIIAVPPSAAKDVRAQLKLGMTPEQIIAQLTGQAAPAAAPAAAEAGPPIIPEPRADLAAQAADVQNPETPPRAMYVGPQQLDELQYTRQLFHGGNLREVKDANGGVLLTDNDAIAAEYEAAGATDEARAKALGYAEAKSAIPNMAEAVMVERTDPATGAVSSGQVVSPATAPAAVAQQAQAAAATGENVVVSPPAVALEARAERAAGEKLPLGRMRASLAALKNALNPPKKRKRLKLDRQSLQQAIANAVVDLHGGTKEQAAQGTFAALESRGLLTEEQANVLAKFTAQRGMASAGDTFAKGEGGRAAGSLNIAQLTELATKLIAAMESVTSSVTDEQYSSAATSVPTTGKPVKRAASATKEKVGITPKRVTSESAPDSNLETISYIKSDGTLANRPGYVLESTLEDGTRIYAKGKTRLAVSETGEVGEFVRAKGGTQRVAPKGTSASITKSSKEQVRLAEKNRIAAEKEAEAKKQKAEALGLSTAQRHEVVGTEGEIKVSAEPLTRGRRQLLEATDEEVADTAKKKDIEAHLNSLIEGITAANLAPELARMFGTKPDKDASELAKAQHEAYNAILAASQSWPADRIESALATIPVREMMNNFPGGAWPAAAQKEWIALHSRVAQTAATKRTEPGQKPKLSLKARMDETGKSVRELRAEARAARELAATAVAEEELTDLTVVEQEAAEQQLVEEEMSAADELARLMREQADEMAADQEAIEQGQVTEDDEWGTEAELDTEYDMDRAAGFNDTYYDRPNRKAEHAGFAAALDNAGDRNFAAALTRALSQAGRDGKPITATSLLKWIASAPDAFGLSAWQQYLVKMLIRLNPTATIHGAAKGDNDIAPDFYARYYSNVGHMHADRPVVLGAGDRLFMREDVLRRHWIGHTPNPNNKQGVITVNLSLLHDGDAVNTILHEIIHAVSATAMSNDIAFFNQVRNLMQVTINAMGESWRTHYGNATPYEFIAEAFTDPAFQETLASIPVPPNLRGKFRAKNLWQAFITLVKRALNIPAVPHSVLEEILGASSRFAVNTDVKLTTSDMVALAEDVAEYDMQEYTQEYKGGLEQDEFGRYNAPRRRHIPAQAQAAANVIGSQAAKAATEGHPSAWGWMMFGHLERTGKRILRGIPGGQAFSDYTATLRKKMHAAREMQFEGEVLVRALLKFGDKFPAMAENFGILRHDATQYEVDPTVPFSHPNNAHLQKYPQAGQLVYNRVQAQYAALNAEGQRLFREEKQFHETQMERKRYAGLSILLRSRNVPQPQTVLNAFLGLNSAVPHLTTPAARLNLMTAILTPANATPAAQKDAQQRASDIMQKAERLIKETSIKGSYFPLNRQGDYVVEAEKTGQLPLPNYPQNASSHIVAQMTKAAIEADQLMHPGRTYEVNKNAQGVVQSVTYTDRVVSMHQTHKQALEMRDGLRQQGFAVGNPTARIETFQKHLAGAEDILSTLQSSGQGQQVTDAVREAYIEMLVENSIRKSELARQNIIGAEKSFADGVRTLANRAYAGSWAIADMNYILDEQEAMGKLLDLQKDSSIPNVAEIGHLITELRLRKELDREDREQNGSRLVQSALTRTAFVYYLGSLSYAMTNFTQLLFVGVPFLMAKHGPIRTTTAILKHMSRFTGVAAMRLARGTADIARLRTHHLDDFFTDVLKTTYDANGNPTPLTNALNELSLRNIMDSSQVFELGRIAAGRGQSKYKALRYGSRIADYIESGAKFLPQMTEIMNRVVLGAAAFELEQGHLPGNAQAAIDYAHEAIDKTQGDYSDHNKSRWMRSVPMQRVVALYKTYPYLMYTFMAEHLSAAIRPVDTSASAQEQALQIQERKVGRRALAYLFGINFAALGTTGVMIEPLKVIGMSVAALMEGLDLGGDDDEARLLRESIADPQLGLKRFFHDTQSEFMADLITEGFMNQTGADWLARIGMHHLAWMPQYGTDNYEDAIRQTIVALGGPVAALALRPARAMDAMARGDTRGAWKAIMPKAVGDIIKSQDISENGRGLVDGRGTVIAGADRFSVGDVVWQGIGFSPTEASHIYEQKNLEMGIDAKLRAEMDNALIRWTRAKTDEEIDAANEAIDKLNAQVIDRKLRITGATKYRARVNMRKREREYDRNQYGKTRDAEARRFRE